MRGNPFRNTLFLLLMIVGAGCSNPSEQPSGPLPDLTVLQVTAPSGLVQRTDPLNLGASVENAGAGAAGAFVLEYRLSADTVPDGGDLLIASTPVTGLDPGETYEDPVANRPSVADLGGGCGTQFILVVVDAGSQVAETSETNNTNYAAIAVVYDRVIIDTYGPLQADFDIGNTGALYTNVIELFGPSGDTSTPQDYDLWSPPAELVSAAIASHTGGDPGRPITNPFYDYAYIDCTLGLAPGDYYLRLYLVNPGDALPYALRALTEPDETYSGWLFTTTNASDTSDAPITGGWGVPSSFQSLVLGDKLNRYLPAGGVHWVKITLP